MVLTGEMSDFDRTPSSKDVSESMRNLLLRAGRDSFDLDDVPTVRLGRGTDVPEETNKSENSNKTEKSDGPKTSEFENLILGDRVLFSSAQVAFPCLLYMHNLFEYSKKCKYFVTDPSPPFISFLHSEQSSRDILEIATSTST